MLLIGSDADVSIPNLIAASDAHLSRLQKLNKFWPSLVQKESIEHFDWPNYKKTLRRYLMRLISEC
jgi:hypothetical protein